MSHTTHRHDEILEALWAVDPAEDDDLYQPHDGKHVIAHEVVDDVDPEPAVRGRHKETEQKERPQHPSRGDLLVCPAPRAAVVEDCVEGRDQPEGRSQAEQQEGSEEEDGDDGGRWDEGDRGGEDYEGQPGPRVHHVAHRNALGGGEVPDNAEHHKAAEDATGAIRAADDGRISSDVDFLGKVRAVCNHYPRGDTGAEEDLAHRIYPYERVHYGKRGGAGRGGEGRGG
mmetsp:Transcript_5433/g.18385  ORF Transcript_5433/g.18385 Transcript_5433/m.18385 type:complete len:228 (+) Transcript_5433:156-839(+)